jgi:hypothetical protein
MEELALFHSMDVLYSKFRNDIRKSAYLNDKQGTWLQNLSERETGWFGKRSKVTALL